MGNEPTRNAGDTGIMRSIPGSGRSPGERYSNLLQYPCLENPMDRGAYWTTVHMVAKESDTTEATELEPFLNVLSKIYYTGPSYCSWHRF